MENVTNIVENGREKKKTNSRVINVIIPPKKMTETPDILATWKDASNVGKKGSSSSCFTL
eukprot:13336197-Ditylum_brightwellii.AAC.1